MSHNRLGTLSAGLLGLGWLAAIGVYLLAWYPQIQEAGPAFWDNGDLFLGFVRDNLITWRVYHLGTTIGLMAAVFLVGLLPELAPEDSRARAFTYLGLTGMLFGLIASLIDQFATPVAARFAAGNPLLVLQIWDYMEPFRDTGLKTVSYWSIGIWMWWLVSLWRQQEAKNLSRFTGVVGTALLLLALIETFIPPPLIYTLGETGIGGLTTLLFPIWGLWVARWFWDREVAEVLGEE